jgi:hypothetical protein
MCDVPRACACPDQAYGRAAELDPARLLALVRKGAVERSLGGFSEAAASFKRALAVDAGHPAALLGFGATLLESARARAAAGAMGAPDACPLVCSVLFGPIAEMRILWMAAK